jgi:hypothetical protein
MEVATCAYLVFGPFIWPFIFDPDQNQGRMASHVQDIWTSFSMSISGSGLRSEHYNPP